MHIMMVAPERLPVPGSGSVEICMLSIAEQLAKQHTVTIVSRQTAGHPPVSEHNGVTVVRVPALTPESYLSSVIQHARGQDYDLIQVDNRPGFISRIKQVFPSIPVTIFLHSLTFVPNNREVSASLRKADLIIANSRSLRDSLLRRFPMLKRHIHTVHLGVDLARFSHPNRVRRPNSFSILFVGRIVPRKGVPVLIQAAGLVARKIPGTSLVIVGSGKPAYIQRLKAMARKMGIPAHFTGRVPHGTIHQRYWDADCLVCPSQRHESFGLVNVEAMAAGVPVVASRIGGIKEIVKHNKSGYLVSRYRSPASFAAYMLKIARNKALADKLSDLGQQMVMRRFSWRHTADRLMKSYRSLV